MAIPNGYRLLTKDDVGKVFGVDLESIVYFDEDITPTFYLTSIGSLNLTNFCREERDYLPYAEAEISSGVYLNGSGYIYYELAGSFWTTEADLSGVEITSFNTDYSWNTWFYVKDKADPYSIKIKTKNGIKLLTKDKDIHFDDDVKITIDESLLGGGEAKKYNFTLTCTDDYNGEGPLYYSVDGGEFQELYAYDEHSLTGNYVVISGVVVYGSYLEGNVAISVTGGNYVTLNESTYGVAELAVVNITEDNAVISVSIDD